MDASSIAAGLTAARSAETQTAIAARTIKMDAEAGDAIAGLLKAAQEDSQTRIEAATGAGIGRALDVRA
jgi:hypothetical protein